MGSSLSSVTSSLTLLLALVVLPACYEGWDYDKKGNGTGDPTPPPPGPQATAPFYMLIFEPIVLAPDAITDTTCFPSEGIAAFRTAEWSERTTALTAALQPLAERFIIRPRTIAKADCGKVTTVRSAALDTKPWAPDPEPGADALDRKLVEVKAVFWQDDVQLDPPAVVLNSDWTAWRALATAGRRTLSAHHFVLGDSGEGYFKSWHDALPAEVRVDGTAITDINPSDAGVKKRQAQVQKDAAAVAAWLLQRK